MRIYRCVESPAVAHCDANGLTLSDGRGQQMRFVNGALCYLHQASTGAEAETRVPILRKGQQAHVRMAGRPQLKHARSGAIVVEDADGTPVEIAAELAFAHALAACNGRGERAVVCYLYSFDNDGEEGVFACDLDSERFCIVPDLDIVSPVVLEGRIYGYNRSTKALERRGLDLALEWQGFAQGKPRLMNGPSVRASTPHHTGGGILLYMGHQEKVEVGQFKDQPLVGHRRGLLCSFDKDSGALRWQRDYAQGIEDLVVDGDRVWLAGSDELELLHTADGSTLASMRTGLSTQFLRLPLRNGIALHLERGLLYAAHQDSGHVLVLDADTLSLRASHVLPDGWVARNHAATDATTGKLYFDAALSPASGSTSCYHFALLEVDPARLDEPAMLEAGPTIDVRLVPSAGKPEERELWIEVSGDNLDDAIRLGELRIHEEAYTHGHTYAGYHVEPTPGFNGLVNLRFEVPGCAPDLLAQRLALMQQRFDHWVREDRGVYAATDRRTPCALCLVQTAASPAS